MTIKINGDNHSSTPGITSGDTDTGFVFGNDNVKLSIGGTQKLEVDSSGQVIIDTVGISGAGTQADIQYPGIVRFYDSQAGAERLRVQANGGISFNGDTAAANALDDYEEGTWTPTVNSGTCTVQSAAYTKIGRYVHAHCRIHSFSGTSGGFHLTGLPYAIDNNACNDQNVGTAWGIGVGSTGELHFWSQTSGLTTSAHAYAGGSSSYGNIYFGSTITGSSNLLVALHYITST